MKLTVRHANSGDIPVLRRLLGQLSGHEPSPQQVENRLALVAHSPTDSLYVCEQGGAVVGALGFRIRENLEEVSRYGEISLLVVHEEARRQGDGRLMMEHTEKLAERGGCKGTWLVSGFGREEQAHRFYEELGYRSTGYRFVKSPEC
jgi:GNAT superfamily N-acetyltransferase